MSPVSTAACLTCLAVQWSGPSCSGPAASALPTAYGESNTTANMATIFFIYVLTHLLRTLFGCKNCGCLASVLRQNGETLPASREIRSTSLRAPHAPHAPQRDGCDATLIPCHPAARVKDFRAKRNGDVQKAASLRPCNGDSFGPRHQGDRGATQYSEREPCDPTTRQQCSNGSG